MNGISMVDILWNRNIFIKTLLIFTVAYFVYFVEYYKFMQLMFVKKYVKIIFFLIRIVRTFKQQSKI